MIQPLKSTQKNWLVFWIDLDEPVPSGEDFFLPTLVVVSGPEGIPVAPPEVMFELDQVRTEQFLSKLIEKHGAPDRVVICASEDWDEEGWRSFSEEMQVEIRFQKFKPQDPEAVKILAKTVVAQYGRTSGPADRQQKVARGLCNTAMRLRSMRRRIAFLKVAVKNDPDCATARIELADAEFQKGNWKSCLADYEIIIGKESSIWQQKSSVRWWEDEATRPFLRALYGRAMTWWHQGQHVPAAKAFVDLIELNPVDHQGARFFIPLLWLLAEDYEGAATFFEGYEKTYQGDFCDPAFHFAWGLVLAHHGREAEAREKYRRAILRNLYIAPLLLDLPEPPPHLWSPNDRGELAYAQEFFDSYGILWERDPRAVRLLRETFDSLQDRLREIITHRQSILEFQDQRFDPDYRKKWHRLIKKDEELSEMQDL